MKKNNAPRKNAAHRSHAVKETLKKILLRLGAFFTTRIHVKIVALCCALIFAFYVQLQKEEAREIELPVIVSNAPPSLAVAENKTETTRISLRGPSDRFEGFDLKTLAPYIDLSNAQKGRDRYPIALQGKTPDGMHVFVRPNVATVTLDNIETKWVTVEASLAGSLPPGHTLSGYSVTPSQMKITGPASALASITRVTTEWVDLRRIFRSTDQSVTVRKIRYVTFETPVVNVHIDVMQERATKTIPYLIAAPIGLPSRFTIASSSSFAISNVVFAGPRAAIDALSVNDLTVTLDLSAIDAPGWYTNVPVHIACPSEIMIQSNGALTVALEIMHAR